MDAYYPTIESTFAKSVTYKDIEYDCQIIDTAGQVSPNNMINKTNSHDDCKCRMNIPPLTHSMRLVYMAMYWSILSPPAIRST